MNVRQMLDKLCKPHWMAQDPHDIFHNLTPEHIGQLNLMWVHTGRPKLTTGFFDNRLELWQKVGAICNEKIDGSYVRDYATIYTEDEFRVIVVQHKSLFTKHVPTITAKFKVTQ